MSSGGEKNWCYYHQQGAWRGAKKREIWHNESQYERRACCKVCMKWIILLCAAAVNRDGTLEIRGIKGPELRRNSLDRWSGSIPSWNEAIYHVLLSRTLFFFRKSVLCMMETEVVGIDRVGRGAWTRKKKKKKWKHVSVSRYARIACCKALQWEKTALLRVTAVSNGNVELKVGVLLVRLAGTLHVLFPPLACFLFLGLLHVLSRMASLPPQWKGRKKKKKYSKYGLLVLLHQGQQTYNLPPSQLHPDVRHRIGR